MTVAANNLLANEPGVKLIAGKFTGANGSISNASGEGWSAVRDGEGAYTITFTDGGALIASVVGVKVAAGEATWTVSSLGYTQSSGELVIESATIGATPALDDVVGEVHFMALLRQ